MNKDEDYGLSHIDRACRECGEKGHVKTKCEYCGEVCRGCEDEHYWMYHNN